MSHRKTIIFMFMVLFLLLIQFPSIKAENSELFEHYNTGDDNFGTIDNTRWKAQIFTPGNNVHNITYVKLKMFRVNDPGTLEVSIRATNDGKPVGSDLTSGIINASTFTTETSGVWYQINLTSFTLSANTMYAIVAYTPNGSTINYVGWRFDSSSPTYIGGAFCKSTDGETWILQSTWDFMFEEWGELLYYMCQIDSFAVKNYNYTISDVDWDAPNWLLTFTSQGNITVDVGDPDCQFQPKRVVVGTDIWTDWSYNSETDVLSINNVASEVKVYWRLDEDGDGGGEGGGGPTPTPPEPTPPVVPPEELIPLPYLGIVLLVAVVAIVVVASQIRKSKGWREVMQARSTRRRVKWKRPKRKQWRRK